MKSIILNLLLLISLPVFAQWYDSEPLPLKQYQLCIYNRSNTKIYISMGNARTSLDANNKQCFQQEHLFYETHIYDCSIGSACPQDNHAFKAIVNQDMSDMTIYVDQSNLTATGSCDKNRTLCNITISNAVTTTTTTTTTTKN